MSRAKLAVLLAALLVTACASLSTVQARQAESAEQAARAFLDTFNSLDSARFDRFFADDVTMFFPSGPFPKERVEGKAAVTEAFAAFFRMAAERGMTELGIEPLDLRVQEYGTFAVVTFHLRGNGNVGRRSIIFRSEPAGWRIIHFHASSLEQAR